MHSYNTGYAGNAGHWAATARARSRLHGVGVASLLPPMRSCACSRVTCVPEHVSALAEILVLVGGAIPPAPAVPASTMISTRLECVQGHSSRVHVWLVGGSHALATVQMSGRPSPRPPRLPAQPRTTERARTVRPACYRVVNKCII